ncbi:MAG: hypothetical protein JST54_02735 [Deltaproteobacteria bacterium]|nr:hypothetical protein [Deltaproteobacteria bacterium]
MPRTSDLLGSIALVLALVLGAAPAAAEKEDPARQKAKQLIQQGTALYSEGDYQDALGKFRAAYEALPNPKLFFNIGQTAMKLNDAAAAANAFGAFIDQTLPTSDLAQQRAIAQRDLQQLGQQLARLKLVLEPSDAQVTVDGEKADPSGTYMSPGSHKIHASADGFAPKDVVVELHAAENRSEPVRLVAAPPQQPLVVVNTPPPAPQPTRDVPPAATPSTTPSTAAAAVTAPAPAPSHTAAYVAAGGAAVALAASAVFGVIASGENSKLADATSGKTTGVVLPGDVPDLRSGIKRDAAISTVALGVGAVVTGVAAYLFFSSSPEPAPEPHDGHI